MNPNKNQQALAVIRWWQLAYSSGFRRHEYGEKKESMYFMDLEECSGYPAIMMVAHPFVSVQKPVSLWMKTSNLVTWYVYPSLYQPTSTNKAMPKSV
jgi:hypothetical protein